MFFCHCMFCLFVCLSHRCQMGDIFVFAVQVGRQLNREIIAGENKHVSATYEQHHRMKELLVKISRFM